MAERAGFRLVVLANRELHVLGNIDHHRAGTTCGGDVESFMDHARQIGHVLHEVVVLGAGAGDADGVAFLKAIRADQRGRHLGGDADQRDRVHQRVGEAGHRIGGARAGGHQHHAGLAGRAGIALRHVGGALLVPHQDVLDEVLLEHRIVDGQCRTAGISEDMLHPLIGECLDHHLGAGHLLGHLPVPSLGLSRSPFLAAPISGQ